MVFKAKKILLLLVIPIIIGIFLRTYHLFIINHDQPFNLGGLFYETSLQIIKNGFSLPKNIPFYSTNGLPFAYPPLPFYIQATVIKLFSPMPFTTVNLLPPIFSVLSLLLFVLLSKRYLNSNIGILVAVFTFAVIPQAFNEQIEAQGLAESLGTLILIVYIYSLLKFKNTNKMVPSIITGSLLGISILSSPGTVYASSLISIIFALGDILQNHKKNVYKTIRKYLIVATTGILISIPYWGSVILNHGIEIFTDPFVNQNKTSFSLVNFEIFAKTTTFYTTFWKILVILGIITTLIHKQFFLFLILLIIDFIPREIWLISVPLSLLIGYLFENFYSLLKNFKINKTIIKLIIGIFLIFYIFNTLKNGLNSLDALISQTDYDLPKTHIDDLSRLKHKIPEKAGLIVIGNWGLIEWSPSLLEHEVLNNQFGLEWQPQKEIFAKQLTTEIFDDKTLDKTVKKIITEYPEHYSELYFILDNNLKSLLKFMTTTHIEYHLVEQLEHLSLLKVDTINVKIQ